MVGVTVKVTVMLVVSVTTMSMREAQDTNTSANKKVNLRIRLVNYAQSHGVV